MQVVLMHTQLPYGWKKQEIRMKSDDLQAIKTLQAVNGIKFNLTNGSFARLPGNKKDELLRFIGYYVYLEGDQLEQLRQGDLLLQLARGYLNSYLKQKEAYLEYHDIRILRHMIQKFVFLSYISHLFGNKENVKTLNQDILEISLRTILLGNASNYKGYRYFADLKNSLLYLLKYIQDMKYFYDNGSPGSGSYADVTIGISKELCGFVKERLTAINLLIGDKPVKISIHEVVGEKKINLRNLVSQLDKLKVIFKPGDQLFFQRICDCTTYNSQLYNCLLFADSHVITGTGSEKYNFDECFERYFSLQETKISLE
jgi:hypothetical protein